MNLKEIGLVLKNRRKELKLTQQEVSDLAEVNINTLVAIERGSGNPLLKSIIEVAGVLGMEIILNK